MLVTGPATCTQAASSAVTTASAIRRAASSLSRLVVTMTAAGTVTQRAGRPGVWSAGTPSAIGVIAFFQPLLKVTVTVSPTDVGDDGRDTPGSDLAYSAPAAAWRTQSRPRRAR